VSACAVCLQAKRRSAASLRSLSEAVSIFFTTSSTPSPYVHVLPDRPVERFLSLVQSVQKEQVVVRFLYTARTRVAASERPTGEDPYSVQEEGEEVPECTLGPQAGRTL